MFQKLVTRRSRRNSSCSPSTSPVTTPVPSPTRNSSIEDRQAAANAQQVALEHKIDQWELRANKQRARLHESLAEISMLKSKNMNIPETLKKAYGRRKDAVRTTEAQIEKLRVKREDVARAADLALLTDAIGNANSVVDGFQHQIDRVGDVLATAQSQSEEAEIAAQALAEASGEMYEVDIDDEIEQFERENCTRTGGTCEKSIEVAEYCEDSKVENEDLALPKAAFAV